MVLNRGICRCRMYVSTGKKTVSGQKAMLPRNPRMLLKKGNTMQKAVVVVMPINTAFRIVRLVLPRR